MAAVGHTQTSTTVRATSAKPLIADSTPTLSDVADVPILLQKSGLVSRGVFAAAS